MTTNDNPDAFTPSFEDMRLQEGLLRGIYSYGFKGPTAIQQRAIVPLIEGGDLIAQGLGGSGKSTAWIIGLLSRLDFSSEHLQALVLSPTRELANRNYEALQQIGDYLAGQRTFCQTFLDDDRGMQDASPECPSGMIVAIGTPGKVLELISRKALPTEALRFVVLDDADEAIGDLEFIKDIRASLTKPIQFAIFASYLARSALDSLTQSCCLANPTRIALLETEIKQFYVPVEEEATLDTLLDLYESFPGIASQSVIYVNARRKIEYIAEALNQSNHAVSTIQTEVAKGEPEKVASTFNSGSTRILITTDGPHCVTIANVFLVINYDLPVSQEAYHRRVCRYGHKGAKGAIVSFVCQRDVERLREIEADYRAQIEELPKDFLPLTSILS